MSTQEGIYFYIRVTVIYINHLWLFRSTCNCPRKHNGSFHNLFFFSAVKIPN